MMSSHPRLAAIALLILEAEEEAFWCLVHITNNLMPHDYYSNTLIGSQVSLRLPSVLRNRIITEFYTVRNK